MLGAAFNNSNVRAPIEDCITTQKEAYALVVAEAHITGVAVGQMDKSDMPTYFPNFLVMYDDMLDKVLTSRKERVQQAIRYYKHLHGGGEGGGRSSSSSIGPQVFLKKRTQENPGTATARTATSPSPSPVQALVVMNRLLRTILATRQHLVQHVIVHY